MDRKKLILIALALTIAAVTALAARGMMMGTTTPVAEAAPRPTGPRVLVAQRALPAGTIVTADSIRFEEWPKQLVKDAYYLDGATDMNSLLGTVVRLPITAGEPVTQGALVSPRDRGFLAAALTPGMRAITISVSESTGVGGFVFPGDRVDLLLTQQIAPDNGRSGLNASETILRGLRVLATDRSTNQAKGDDGNTVVTGFNTVTLEVTPNQAEQVAVAQTLGQLSLSLRSLSDSQDSVEQAIASGEVDIPENATPAQEERILRRAAARPAQGGDSYATGGDVSRFQNKSFVRLPQSDRNSGTSSMGPVYPSSDPVPGGPAVRVTRGTDTSVVPIGRNGQARGGTGAARRSGGESLGGSLGGSLGDPVAGPTAQGPTDADRAMMNAILEEAQRRNAAASGRAN